MGKKPSEWSPQEAVVWFRSEVAKMLREGGFESTAMRILALPFPSDPPEVVDSEILRRWVNEYSSSHHLHQMARELLARREAERKA